MYYEWVNGERRQPVESGERTVCSLCQGVLTGVLSMDRRPHWRHMSRKDCDKWSEPEGDWHLAWKERFPMEAREFPMINPAGERHRADVFLTKGGTRGLTVELQHSAISEPEARAREAFYGERGPMLWVVHLHDENAFHATTFRLALEARRNPIHHGGKMFLVCTWYSSSKAFLKKWVASNAHVVFDFGGQLFYLATDSKRTPFVAGLKKGEFAVMHMTQEEFMAGVQKMAEAA